MLNSPEIKCQRLKAKNMHCCFQAFRCCIYPANKCKNANDCWYFNIYEQDKLHAQLLSIKKFYDPRARKPSFCAHQIKKVLFLIVSAMHVLS